MSQSNPFLSMKGQAEKWRGECIQQFAELEQVLDELLRGLASIAKPSEKVVAGQQIGPAFKQARELTGSKGPFESIGKSMSATLDELNRCFDWRAHLTHGVLTIWRDEAEKWLLALSHRPSGADTVRTSALTWDEARKMLQFLEEQIPKARMEARALVRSALANSQSSGRADTPSA